MALGYSTPAEVYFYNLPGVRINKVTCRNGYLVSQHGHRKAVTMHFDGVSFGVVLSTFAGNSLTQGGAETYWGVYDSR